MKTNTMAFSFSQKTKPLSILKILTEALKLLAKKPTLTLSIILLTFLTSSLFVAFANFYMNPLLADITAKATSIASLDPQSPEYTATLAAIIKDVREFFTLEAIFLVISSIVYLFVTIVTIRALSTSCSKGLKAPVITGLYVKALSWGYSFLLAAVLGIILYVGHGSLALMVSDVILAISGMFLYLYLFLVWSVGVVISVVEDGCYGLDAISKAREVTRGRKEQVVMLSLTVFAINGMVFGAFMLASFRFPLPSITQVLIQLVYVAVAASLSVFAWATFLAFYYDCKKGNQGMESDSNFMYGSVPTAESDIV